MTKCITSVAVAICMEDGLLRLEDPLEKFIPTFANAQVRLEGDDKLVSAERPYARR
jgi:CubicO group peptidase (beta-lactamase class C family)